MPGTGDLKKFLLDCVISNKGQIGDNIARKSMDHMTGSITFLWLQYEGHDMPDMQKQLISFIHSRELQEDVNLMTASHVKNEAHFVDIELLILAI
ncbi:hypothetical protein EW146_g7730 [Bondarzewia mesenterica]|uniref:Uncharacterized protein n=1 Tax=Bondarzewia mesenterica TaxID=1095465 RepID=A0A4S4LJZ4_9AGAM|nr:hypothetical protein EW146_g7730 [Bondarzewia mesenterica]